MSSLAKNILATGKHDHPHGGGHVNRRVHLLLSLKGRVDKKWTHTFPPYTVRPNDVLIAGNTRLKDIGIAADGTLLETPGHSSDSIAVLFDDGNCFAGDAAANFLQFAGRNTVSSR